MNHKGMITVLTILLLIAGIILTIFFLKGVPNDNTDVKVILNVTVREDGVAEMEIYNNGDEKIDFGPGYELQIYEDGEWQLYPEERGFDAIALMCYPGEFYVEHVWLNEELTNKKVRVVKEIEGVEYYSNDFKLK